MDNFDPNHEREQISAEIQGKTVCDLLLTNALEHPTAPALSWNSSAGWQTLTWQQYRRDVLELASGLTTLGVLPGDKVAIMSSNRVENILAFMGAIHVGATPTILYNTLPAGQIAYIANDSQAKVAILETESFLSTWLSIKEQLPYLKHIVVVEKVPIPSEASAVLYYEDLKARGQSALESFSDPYQGQTPEDPVTLIYTSGTTGPPKGVLLSHQQCLWEAVCLDQLTDLPDGIRHVSYLPLAHIAEQLLSVYIPLRKMVHVFFCPDVTQAVTFVQKARPSMFFGVPRVWEKMKSGLLSRFQNEPKMFKRKMLERALRLSLEVVKLKQRGEPVPWTLSMGQKVYDRLIFSKIRQAIGLDHCHFIASAAAPLPVEVSEFFSALGLPILEVYGMTECAGVATANRPDCIKIGSVGPCLPGVEVKLAEDNEILLRGPNCITGYFNQKPDLNELVDSQGWLHTGDIGRQDQDGYLFIIDRKKELIITAGGKNISPANIENFLKEHPLIGQALAYGDRMKYVVALIVLDPQTASSFAKEKHITGQTIADLAQHPEIKKEIEAAVTAANQRLARVEQIKRFCILKAEWTPESGELTPTMKLRRQVICKKYQKEIQDLYAAY